MLSGQNAANEELNGLAGNDLLFGNGGADTLNGGDNSDLLVGGAGNDILNGGTGNDWLVAGAGVETLTGGTDADRFVMTSAAAGEIDTITDYLLGSDLIDLSYLLQGETAGTISSFVSYNAGTGALSVDINGTVGGASFTQIATVDTIPGGAIQAPSQITILFDGSPITGTTIPI